jgi:hypothetical protein
MYVQTLTSIPVYYSGVLLELDPTGCHSVGKDVVARSFTEGSVTGTAHILTPFNVHIATFHFMELIASLLP